jgi:hypothetical protein
VKVSLPAALKSDSTQAVSAAYFDGLRQRVYKPFKCSKKIV